MKSTDSRTAVNAIVNVAMKKLRNVDWEKVAANVGAAAQLSLMVIVMAAEMAYENRQQIRDAAVKAVAAIIVTGERIYRAGKQTRNWVERMNASSAVALKEMPEQLSAVAPIAAPIIAIAKSATAALSDWLRFSENEEEGSETLDEVVELEKDGFGAMLVEQLDELRALPAATLREMVGTRTRYPKAQLVAMLMVS